MLVIVAFLLGYTRGRLQEIDRKVPVEVRQEAPALRMKKATKVSFTDQLDPVMPESTKRNPIKPDEEVDYDRD